jgi:hypothetical protein
MLLAGDPEQPGRAVRGTEKIPDAVTFDAGNVHPELREPPQRRRAESPQADNDHVFADDLHRRRPYPHPRPAQRPVPEAVATGATATGPSVGEQVAEVGVWLGQEAAPGADQVEFFPPGLQDLHCPR